MANETFVFDVFISYSRIDHSWVWEWLLPRLEMAGLRVCIDTRDFDIGVPIVVNIERAVERSRKTLLVLTPEWVMGGWTNFESLLIQTTDPVGLRRRMIPLMLRRCEPPSRVSIFTYADFTQTEDWESEFNRILDAVNDRTSLPEQEISPAQVTSRFVAGVSTNNLPARLTSFVGREREITETVPLLMQGHLLTLTGAPGVGKSRLALELVREQLDTYRDGVWLVEMASLDTQATPDDIIGAIARVLDLREEPGRPLGDTLVDALQPKQLLLVLDNCEHIIEPCAAIASRLLMACSSLHILATSREALRISGEVEWNVSPLPIPDDPGAMASVEATAKCESVHLFTERAQAIQPAFVLTSQNVHAVARICRLVEGLPLALELVVVWLNVLSVEQIAARLDGYFWSLTGTSRSTLPHHQTLRGAIGWSYDLLSDIERVVFNRLSIFAGGFTLADAEAVVAGGDVAAYKVLDVLAELVNKSLVTAEEGPDVSMLYRLLVPLQQFGKEQLVARSEIAAVRRSHAEHYLRLAEETESRLYGETQGLWQNRMRAENDNFQTALHWMEETENMDHGLRLAAALFRFWWLIGHFNEGRYWLESMLSKDKRVSISVQAKAFYSAGWLAYHQGDFQAADGLFEKSLASYRTLADDRGVAQSLHALGSIELTQGEFLEAQRVLEESLVLQRKLENRRDLADTIDTLGNVFLCQGAFSAARPLFEESMAIFRDQGHKLGIANSMHNLGLVAHYEKDLGKACTLLGQSLSIYRELGYKEGIAFSLNNLGNVLLDQGDHEAAEACFKESLTLTQELDAREGIAYLLESFGNLAIAQGRPTRTARLFGAAEILREVINAPLPPDSRVRYDESRSTLVQQLDATSLATFWQEGRTMTTEQAIQFALAEN